MRRHAHALVGDAETKWVAGVTCQRPRVIHHARAAWRDRGVLRPPVVGADRADNGAANFAADEFAANKSGAMFNCC